MVSIHKTDWLIREATENDFTEIRKLNYLVWGHQRPKKYDHWRYFSLPFGSCQFSLAMKKIRFVRAFMLGPLEKRIGNSIVKGAHAIDVMSHSDYVGRPVFIKAGIHCLESATNLPGIANILSRVGFIAHRRMPLIFRSLSNINFSVNINYHSNWQIYGGDVDTF